MECCVSAVTVVWKRMEKEQSRATVELSGRLGNRGRKSYNAYKKDSHDVCVISRKIIESGEIGR